MARSSAVKVNVADVLAKELARKSWKREVVAIGAATDPYQPAEGRYKLTRACLSVLADRGNPISIITRGPMIVRDLDVLQRAAAVAEVSVNFSIPTLDKQIWRYTEPHTAPPLQRLRALRTLVDGGIRAGVGVAAHPARPVGRSEPAGRRSQGCTRPRRHSRLGERAVPASRNARALPRQAGDSVARARPVLRAAVRSAVVPE